MKLTFGERGRLGDILPKQGDWSTLTHVRNIQNLIIHTEAELKNVGGTVLPDGRINYIPSMDTPEKAKEIKFDDMQLKIIRDTLEGLEKSETLPTGCMSLYEKFVIKG